MKTIWYRNSDHVVVQISSALSRSEIDGCTRVDIDDDVPIQQCGCHRYDQKLMALVELTSVELDRLNSPTKTEVTQRIQAELSGTDWLMVEDAPILKFVVSVKKKMNTNEARDIWKTYRQALRDLSSLGDFESMLRAWPTRPDGIDAVADLRARLDAAKIK